MKTETINDIPNEKVQQVVEDYQSEGYRTEVHEQPNGYYTVIAVFKN